MSETATETATAPTVAELQQRVEEKRRAAGITTTSSRTAEAELSIPERTSSCRCGAELRQYRIAGAWGPESCDACRSVPGESEEAPRYSGDVLEDLRTAGVNVWKYGDASLEAAWDKGDPDSIANHDQDALVNVEHWINEYWRAPRPRRYAPRDWMYLYGKGSNRDGGKVQLGRLGNGKTYLAVAIARYLVERGMLDPKQLRFTTAESILIESEATFRANSDDSEKNLLRRYEQPELLIVDDFGVRDMSPHAIRLFDELTKRREAKATIWTSNLSVRVVAKHSEFMRRIADRIAGECGEGAAYMIGFSGPSRRIARSRRPSGIQEPAA